MNSRAARIVLFAALVILPLRLAVSEENTEKPPYNPYLEVLLKHGLRPELDDLTEYLESLLPTDEERAKRDALAATLIGQLGDPNFSLREQAMHKLVSMVDLPRDKLQAAVQSRDPEIRWRSEKVLALSNRPNPIPEAVCRTIQIHKIKGAAPALLRVMGELSPDYVRQAGEDALVATARVEDAELLLGVMKSDSEDMSLQTAAIAAYGAALGEGGADELRPLLSAKDARVQLAAAEALANIGERTVLPTLLLLLEHEDVEIRASAVAVLRGLTEQQFGYLAYDDAEKRLASVEKWRKWIAGDGRTAKLTFPLPAFSRRAEIGHTIILLYQQHKAIELNAAGEKVWEIGNLNFPWAVERLANGNTVIGSYRGKWVAEYDRQGIQVWRKEGLPGGVFGLQRLANGNTLLGLHSGKKVIEIDREGKTVWEAVCDGQPMGVQRLANGHTMVALHSGNKVVELDRAGKVVWEVAGLRIPRTVQRLSNGNTLVGDSSNNRAVEFNREKKIVWTHSTKGNVYEARRLSNGNTLISDTSGVYIVNPAGKTEWSHAVSGSGRAIRF